MPRCAAERLIRTYLQHTSAYVSIREHTSATYMLHERPSIPILMQHTYADVC
jgi:hypothetical protein